MNASFTNELVASFSLFVAHEIQYFCSSFQSTSGQLFLQQDPRYSQYNIYNSPFSQWISDESVTNIPSGIYNNGNFLGRDSGVILDFLNGRALYSGVLNNPTAAYSIPEVNVYYSDAPLDSPELLINNAFSLTPQIAQVTGGLSWEQQAVPCLMFQTNSQENSAAALGSLNNANNVVECYIIATNTYQLDALAGALSDTARKYIPLFSVDQLPYTVLGDIKNNSYNYQTLSNEATRSVFISKVMVDKYDEGKNKSINRTIWGARVRFELVYQFDNI